MATAVEQAKIATRMKELQKMNKQCFNCATLVGGGSLATRGKWIQLIMPLSQGTAYVVPAYNVFVCTECSGKQ